MGTRGFAQVPPTAATIALNAYIFGYAGHSLVTPHAALKQLWWTDDRIERKITRSFVISKLRGEERQFLDRPLAFGEGLTDDTYMEWILERAQRLFLILAEIGVPDQIFGCVDDSWDDGDLPITLKNVRKLELSYENNDVLNKKFYDTQFIYLLRELTEDTHIDYGPNEHIPMEYVHKLPPAVSLQSWDRVHFPGRPNDMFMRRKFALLRRDSKEHNREQFLQDVRQSRHLRHQHIAPVWASYISDEYGYVLSDYVAEHTLSTFIDHRTPFQFVKLPASQRPVLLMEWLHCLADAVASLHHRLAHHGAIRPSNILIDHDNRISFADVGTLRTFQKGKTVSKTEVHDYAPPESQLSRELHTIASSPPTSSTGAFAKLRKMSSDSSASSNSSSRRSNASSTRSNSMSTVATSPMPQSSSSFRNFSRHLIIGSTPPASVPSSPLSIKTLPKPSVLDPELLRDLPTATPEMSDIYALGCIFLDIITFMMKGKLTDFVKFRTSRVSNSKGKIRTDTSFHSNPDKVDAWISMLRNDSPRHGEDIFRGVPELLLLVKRMLAQNATLRPAALETRDRILDVLVSECGVETLCCAGREWPSDEVHPLDVRDSVSVATGLTSASRNDSQDPGVLSPTDAATTAGAQSSRRRSSATSAKPIFLPKWRDQYAGIPFAP